MAEISRGELWSLCMYSLSLGVGESLQKSHTPLSTVCYETYISLLWMPTVMLWCSVPPRNRTCTSLTKNQAQFQFSQFLKIGHWACEMMCESNFEQWVPDSCGRNKEVKKVPRQGVSRCSPLGFVGIESHSTWP